MMSGCVTGEKKTWRAASADVIKLPGDRSAERFNDTRIRLYFCWAKWNVNTTECTGFVLCLDRLPLTIQQSASCT